MSFAARPIVGSRSVASQTYAASTQEASLNVTSLSGYQAGSTDITITINAGVYLWSDSTSTAGLTLAGGTVGDTITIVNNGFVMGKGGNGATYSGGHVPATAGGPAVSLGFNTTITNTAGYIGGGGGGGAKDSTQNDHAGGGGAGGGAGGRIAASNNAGASGSIGNAGTDGTSGLTGGGSGGGGRILPGTGGPGATHAGNEFGSGGGAGGGGSRNNGSKATGGGGGGWGAAGGSAQYNASATSGNAGDGGSSGSAGSNGVTSPVGSITAGAAGGKAVALNGYAVTWTGGAASSSRAYGAVS